MPNSPAPRFSTPRRASAAAVALLSIALLGGSRPAAAVDVVTRLTDLRAGASHGVPVFDAAVFGGQLYFQAQDDATGTDLWRYDGVNPPAMVAGTDDIAPSGLVVWDGALYFAAALAGDRELWRFDGVNPPIEALDLAPAASSSPAEMTPFDDRLCFRANLPSLGVELACWDGDGPAELFDLRPGLPGGSPEELTVVGAELYLSAQSDAAGREPWSFDGLAAPTPIGDLRPGATSSNPESFVALGGALYFRASDDSGQGRLWRRTGSAPPELLSDEFDIEGGLVAYLGELLVDGFLESNEGVGPRLQRFASSQFQPLSTTIDGSGETILLGANSFTPFSGALYFLGSQATPATRDFYRYCGAGIGSIQRVTDAFAAGGDYVQANVVAFQGKLLFSARTDGHGAELWQLETDVRVSCDGFESGSTANWSSTTP
jgi:ELWxxDGT repeat protein